jgi:hypothetical protein
LHKIQASGQRIEYFERLQVQCGIATPLKIPLHGNMRWGSAFNMLNRAYQLRQVFSSCSTYRTVINSLFQVIKLFITATDELFGLITVIHRNGHVKKQIRWSAFHLKEADLACIVDAKAILAVSS